MGWVIRTSAGTFRANWRDPTGRQKAKTFRTRRAAAAFLAETEGAANRGTYVDPHAGRTRFGEYAKRWLAARSMQNNTAARDRSVMRTHVLARWETAPLGKIDHLAVQEWVNGLSRRLSPHTVAKCHQMTSGVLKAAVRDRLIAFNPCEGVRLPPIRQRDLDGQLTTPSEVIEHLLPVMPDRYRTLVGLAIGTGLRWGECVGLRWDAVHWGRWDQPCEPHAEAFCSVCRERYNGQVRVIRVAVEVAGTVTARPFPKSRAGRRTVPLPPFVMQLLREHQERYTPGPAGEVFTNTAGGPLRRTLFRKRVWRPALVRAGMLGKLAQARPDSWQAAWTDTDGIEQTSEFATHDKAVRHIVDHAGRGLRFHDLRHSYATWLISTGVPVNDVQRVMGHERGSTTLNLYSHGSEGREARVLKAFLAETPGPE